jgi:hypothetical protein
VIDAMRFRFTIRDLLWLTALVAVSVGWWLDHRESKFHYLHDVGYWTVGFLCGCIIGHSFANRTKARRVKP